jgi:alkanesulfonate monooxygenase SsuD/methylene tetrahydromethanopterin reductase-like flavin-dependent oxidoreductase (luciferase family)
MPMQFALFYEIPVARPWTPGKEHKAYKDTLEQAIAADRWGWDAFWTVEHHFLDEYSHCSNPEVLYGAIAARTSKIRIGYGVRLMPKPYNHPVRSAESAAVLDLLSDGRVDFATGRSSSRAELEGFGIDPHQTRAMWQEAIEHIVACWTNDEVELDGKHWQMPRRRVHPKPIQDPHPPIYGATSSDDGHRQIGSLGIGLCSFAVGIPPEQVKQKIDIYRAAQKDCRKPLGKVLNSRAATFTMTLCAPKQAEAYEVARESFEWYPKTGARIIASLAGWMAEQKKDLGNYAYAADMKAVDESGALDQMNLDYLTGAGACVLGTPDQCIETCKRYEEAGVDLLLCLVNPYKIPHESVLQTIELMGRHVIPQFRG